MTNNPIFDNNREGFRIGDYFVTFPPGEFVKEDNKGMYVMVDVYQMDKNGKAHKVNSKMSPEVEQMINDELNKILLEATTKMEEENVKNKSS
jgi:hypothetical protein